MTDRPVPPPPGTLEAAQLGCECPVLDNGYGRGYMGQEGVYVYVLGCPVHDVPDEE